MALVFDIETVGFDFDSMDDITKHLLTRWIKRESASDQDKYRAYLTDLKKGLGFSPLTGEIVAIGVFDTKQDKGVVYFQSPELETEEFQDANFSFKPRTEKEMLASFWQGAKKYDTFISFNGRSFDVPFLMIRSAAHRIRPSINLLLNRYPRVTGRGLKHIDLFDQLSFFGAMRRRGSLHLYCRAFGIRSPKAAGITGDDVRTLFKEKKYKEIAEYNSWDLLATWELYEIWRKYLAF